MPYDFEIVVQDDLVRVEVAGDRSAGDHVANADEVGKAIVGACRDSGIDRILVLSQLTGRASPLDQLRTVLHSIQYGWNRDFTMAFVDLNAETVRETRFVETIALNRVFKVRVFDNEADARSWLDTKN